MIQLFVFFVIRSKLSVEGRHQPFGLRKSLVRPLTSFGKHMVPNKIHIVFVKRIRNDVRRPFCAYNKVKCLLLCLRDRSIPRRSNDPTGFSLLVVYDLVSESRPSRLRCRSRQVLVVGDPIFVTTPLPHPSPPQPPPPTTPNPRGLSLPEVDPRLSNLGTVLQSRAPLLFFFFFSVKVCIIEN